MKWLKGIIITAGVFVALIVGASFVYLEYAKSQPDIDPQTYPELEPTLTPLPEGTTNALDLLAPIAEALQDHEEHNAWQDHDHLKGTFRISEELSELHEAWLTEIEASLAHPMQGDLSLTIDAGHDGVIELVSISRFLKNKSLADISNGNTISAINSAKIHCQLLNSCMQIEGSYVPLLVQFAVYSNNVELIANLLGDDAITDEHLEDLDTAIQGIPLPHANIENAIKCEYKVMSSGLTLLSPATDNPLYKENQTNYELSNLYRQQLQIAQLPTHTDPTQIPLKKYNKLNVFLSSNPVGRTYLHASASSPSQFLIVKQSEIPFTQTLIALKQFQLDHQQAPEELSQLVPDYLSEIPIDPYANAPLKYSKEKKLLWSIGSDFTDNHGQHPKHKSEQAINFTMEEPTARIGL